MSTPVADHKPRDQGSRRTTVPTAPLGTTLRLLARRVHFLAGIVVAPFLVVACLTGLVYAFSPQIHDSLYHTALHVTQPDGARRPVSEQVHTALTAHPEAALQSVITHPAPDRTTRVVLAVPGRTDASLPARTVFVDPYTGFINGELTTVENRLPANTWLRALHSNLHLGEAGRVYAELAASWLPVITAGGLVLWLAKTRRKRRARDLLLPATSGKQGWMRLRGIHGAVGLWLTAGLLVLSATGLTMSQFAGGRTDSMVDPIHLRAPTLTAAPVTVPQNPELISIDRVLAVAGTEGLTGELSVTPSPGGGVPFTVTEIGEGLPIQRDSIAIDPYTAQVTERIDWNDFSLPAKLTTLAVEFHTGSLFGITNQLVLAVVATGLLVLIALGYRMWWLRSPYRGKWDALPPPGWQGVSLPVMVLVLLGVAALSWSMPVFGGSLVGFIVLDGTIGAVKRRRQRSPETAT